MKILHLMPNTDATSFYRGTEPLLQMEKLYDVKVVESNEVNWAILGRADIVFMQRAAGTVNASMLQMAHDNGLPIWIDHDDDLLNVPKDNPTYSTYARSDVGKTLLKNLSIASLVTVSTRAIVESYTKALTDAGLNVPTFEVIPNAFNDFRWSLDGLNTPRRKIVYWRGSPTHTRDLMEFSPDIIKVAKANPEWHWLFLGPFPWMFDGKIKNLIHQDNLDLIKYMAVLKEVSPSINIVPLHADLFNKSKSNIAWLEATYAGALSLAPDWDEWQLPGIVNYKPENFASRLQALIHLTDAAFNAKLSLSQTVIGEKFKLSVMNKKRYDLVEELYESNRAKKRSSP